MVCNVAMRGKWLVGLCHVWKTLHVAQPAAAQKRSPRASTQKSKFTRDLKGGKKQKAVPEPGPWSLTQWCSDQPSIACWRLKGSIEQQSEHMKGGQGAIGGTAASRARTTVCKDRSWNCEAINPLAFRNAKWATTWMHLGSIIWNEMISWEMHIVRNNCSRVCFASYYFIQRNPRVTSAY